MQVPRPVHTLPLQVLSDLRRYRLASEASAVFTT